MNLLSFFLGLITSAVWCAAMAAGLTILPKLGAVGGRLSDICCRAPILDGIVAGFTWVPWVVWLCVGGWAGLLGSAAGELVFMQLWILFHERMHKEAARGPRIVKALNRMAGRWRNHTALLVTMIALPGFWLIRLHEVLVYPFLIWILKFPRYRQGEWINVSRHKFEGLVGHDLIWCLYCDWMTGVYSLGAEMLRNVESFWCPIRFYNGKKCDNCRVDFPDVDGGWVGADGTMAEVEKTLVEQYADGRREWFGHPARLTVRGREIGMKRPDGPNTRA